MFKRPLLPLVAATLLMFAVIVEMTTGPSSRPADNASRAAPPSTPALPVLRDEALERGVFYLHTQISDGITGLDEALGSGACAFDMDNDHDMDLFLVGGSGHRRYYGKPSWWSKQRTGRLYRNRGDGYFDDVTAQSGLAVTVWGMGCNAADFDLDGFTDLLVTGRNRNHLWRNLDGRNFEAIELGDETHWSTSAAIGDYDSDGKMDIYIANYLDYDNAARRFEGLSGFETTNAEFKPENFAPVANLLLTNRGGFEFDESAAALGVDNRDGRSLGAKWFDLNGDQRLDLLVMNDSGSTTRLYLGNADGTFTRASLNKRLELPSGIRAGALQDFDGDGDGDLVLSTRLGEAAALLANRNGEFSNVTWQQHLDSGRFVGMSGYGVQFVDLNNDGELDIYHANGLAMPEPDAHAVSAGQPDLVSLGDGQGRFRPADVTRGAVWQLPISSRSAISVDVDNDGDRDILLSANNNPVRLLINHSPLPAWIGFDIADRYGNAGNFDKLVLTTDRRQTTWFADADTLLGRHDHRVSQALRADESILSVSIHWRNGEITELERPELNAYHVIRQSETRAKQYQGIARESVLVPPKLALWQIKTGRAERDTILASAGVADIGLRVTIIAAIGEHDPGLKLLAVIRAALADPNPDVVLAAIQVLRRLELEASYYWFSDLFRHPDPRVLCAVADTFRHFYIEEEAMIQRKGLAVPQLLRLLDHDNPAVVGCATLALAESKSFRAVVPIEDLLLAGTDNGVLEAAVYALGELRRTRSIDAILSLATEDPHLRQARGRALTRLNIEPGAKPPAGFIQSRLEAEVAPTRCPGIDAPALLALEPRVQAERFENCDSRQRRDWFVENAAQLGPAATALLDNSHFSPDVYALLIGALAQDAGFGITKIFIGRLHRHRGIAEDTAFIQALRSRLPEEGLEKLLKNLFDDPANSKALRIVAGDVLLDLDPDYVMARAEALFHD